MDLSFPNINPVIFSFSIGKIEFALRWYALSYIAGILVAWKLMQLLCKKSSLWLNESPPTTDTAIEDLMTYLILGIILGGRLGYVCFYQPSYYLHNPLDIVKVWNGGMSFHGGFLGVIVGAAVYSWKHKLDLISMGDLIAVASPPGLLFGRLANFINGELWGKPTSSNWGILFPSKLAQTCPEIWIGPCTRHPSQLYEAFLEGLVLWFVMLIFIFFFKSFKRKGETTCIFLIGYGFFRALVEIFREPDAQFLSEINPNGYVVYFNENFGFSMGQLLSSVMIIAGVLFFILVHLRTSPTNPQPPE